MNRPWGGLLSMPSPKRSKLTNVSIQSNSPTRIESSFSSPTPVMSLLKRKSRADSVTLAATNIHPNGFLSCISGKELYVWDRTTLFHFDAPLSDTESSCIVAVAQTKRNGACSVLAVTPEGSMRFWNSIKNDASDYVEYQVPLKESPITHVKSHPKQQGIFVLSTEDGHHFLIQVEDNTLSHKTFFEDETPSASYFSWFPWLSKQNTNQKRDLSRVLQTQLLGDSLFVLTDSTIKRYFWNSQTLDSTDPFLEKIKEDHNLSTETESWLVDFECRSEGNCVVMKVLVAYEFDLEIKYLVATEVVVDEIEENEIQEEPAIVCKYSHASSLLMDHVPKAQILFLGNDMYVLCRDVVISMSRNGEFQEVETLDTNVASGQIVNDRLSVVKDDGKIIGIAPVSVPEEQNEDNIADFPREDIFSGDTTQTQAKNLLRELYFHMRNQTGNRTYLQQLNSGSAIVEASRMLIDANPSTTYRWATSIEDGATKADEIYFDRNAKVPVLVIEDLQKKYRQHHALLNLLNNNANRQNLWSTTLTQEQQKQIIGHGEKLNFAIHLRTLQNNLITESKRLQSRSNRDIAEKIKVLNVAMVHVCKEVRDQEPFNPENFYTQVSQVYQILETLCKDVAKQGEEAQHRESGYNVHTQNVTITLINSVFGALITSIRGYHEAISSVFNSNQFPSSLFTDNKLHFASGHASVFENLEYQIEQTSKLLATQRRTKSEGQEFEQLLIDQLYTMIDFLLETLPNQLYVEQRTLLMPKLREADVNMSIKLAEKYHDFDALVDILAEGPILPKVNKQKLNHYMTKFKDYGFASIVFNHIVKKGWNQTLVTDEEWNNQYHSEIYDAIRTKDQLAWVHAMKHIETDQQKYSTATLSSLSNLAEDEKNNLKDKQVRLSIHKLANLYVRQMDNTSMTQVNQCNDSIERTDVLLHVLRCQEALNTTCSYEPLNESWLGRKSVRRHPTVPATPDKIISSVYNEIITNQLEKLIVNAASDEDESELKIQELEDLFFRRLAIALEVCEEWIRYHESIWRVSDSQAQVLLVHLYHAAMLVNIRIRKRFSEEADIPEQEKVELFRTCVFYRLAKQFMGTPSMLTEEIVDEIMRVEHDGFNYLPHIWSLLEQTRQEQLQGMDSSLNISIASDPDADFLNN